MAFCYHNFVKQKFVLIFTILFFSSVSAIIFAQIKMPVTAGELMERMVSSPTLMPNLIQNQSLPNRSLPFLPPAPVTPLLQLMTSAYRVSGGPGQFFLAIDNDLSDDQKNPRSTPNENNWLIVGNIDPYWFQSGNKYVFQCGNVNFDTPIVWRNINPYYLNNIRIPKNKETGIIPWNFSHNASQPNRARVQIVRCQIIQKTSPSYSYPPLHTRQVTMGYDPHPHRSVNLDIPASIKAGIDGLWVATYELKIDARMLTKHLYSAGTLSYKIVDDPNLKDFHPASNIGWNLLYDKNPFTSVVGGIIGGDNNGITLSGFLPCGKDIDKTFYAGAEKWGGDNYLSIPDFRRGKVVEGIVTWSAPESVRIIHHPDDLRPC
jgi:hypothetical protein